MGQLTAPPSSGQADLVDRPPPGTGALPRGRLRRWSAGAPIVVCAAIPLAFLAIFFAWPVVTMVAKGFWSGGQLDFSAFAEVLTRPRTWRILRLTIAQAALATGLAVLIGLPAAHVLYCRRFRGVSLLRAIISVPFVLPAVVVGVAFRTVLVDGGPLGFLHADGTFGAIIAALVFFNISVVVRTVGTYWSQLDPRATDAARSLGASRWQAWRTVTLAALAPAIGSAATLVFLFCATAFGTVLILGGGTYGTIETEIYLQTTEFLNLGAAAVLSILQLIVVAALLVVSARLRRHRPTMTTPHTEPLRRSDWPALAATLAAAGALALPVAALVAGSLRTPAGWGLDNYRNLGTTGDGALSVPVWQAVTNSLQIALDATWMALAIGTMIAIVLTRRARTRRAARMLGGLDALFMLPLGVSAVTVGFGFLLTIDRSLPQLRGLGLLVPIAQALVALPLVVRILQPMLRGIDPQQLEAAAMLGAPPWRVFSSVELPVIARGLAVAAGYAFAVSLGEFGATAFLARPDHPTLPVVIFRLIGRPGSENLGMALAGSVILAMGTVVVMGAMERMRPRGLAGGL